MKAVGCVAVGFALLFCTVSAQNSPITCFVSASETNVTSCGNESMPCPNLRQCVNLLANTTNSTTIYVRAGEYSGNMNCGIELGFRSIIAVDYPSPTIIDCLGQRAFTFLYNTSTLDENWPVLQGLTIQNGAATGDGGCILVGGGLVKSLTIRNCHFENCSASGSGGALAVLPSPTNSSSFLPFVSVAIANSSFVGNQAKNGGAISAIENIQVENSTFLSNKANDGGAIWADGNVGKHTQLQVSQSKFLMNSATHDGGALHLQNFPTGPATLVNCQISSNLAQNNGGGIYYFAANGGIVLNGIENTQLFNNSATNGGAMFGDTGFLNLLSCQITSNSASQNGGGFYLSNIDFHSDELPPFRWSTVSQNTAINGGGVFSIDSTVYWYGAGSTITSNTAQTNPNINCEDPVQCESCVTANCTSGCYGLCLPKQFQNYTWECISSKYFYSNCSEHGFCVQNPGMYCQCDQGYEFDGSGSCVVPQPPPPNPGGDGVNWVFIIVPVVVGGGVAVAIVGFVFWYRSRRALYNPIY